MIYLIIAMLVGCAAVYLYARKTGGITKSNLKDWRFVLIFFGLVCALALVGKANATETDWFSYTAVYAGLDYHFAEANPQCDPGPGARDNLNSNGGIIQNVVIWSEEYWTATLDGTYTHHSCAIEDDRLVYDAVGIRAEYRIYW